MPARWVRLRGKRTIHLVSSGKSPGGLYAEIPECGASFGFPFEHSRYTGGLNPADFPKCKKCLALEASQQKDPIGCAPSPRTSQPPLSAG